MIQGVTTVHARYRRACSGRSTHLRTLVNAGVLWLHGDPTGMFRMLGSASLLTDAGGSTVGQARYKPFGERRSEWNAYFTDRKFTGYAREDALGGIDFAQARFYDPLIGRFLSPDTIYDGGLADPQGLNRYSYVKGHVMNATDPTGHDGCGVNVGCWIDSWLAAATTRITSDSSYDPVDTALASPNNISGQAVDMYVDTLDKNVIPEAIGVRAGVSGADPKSGLGAGVSVDALYFRRSDEFSVFIAPSVSTGVGRTLTIDAGVVATWNTPNAESYRGGFLNVQAQATNGSVGGTASGFISSPNTGNHDPMGVYAGAAVKGPASPVSVGGSYSYSFEAYNSKKGFIPNPPSPQKVIRDAAASVRQVFDRYLKRE